MKKDDKATHEMLHVIDIAQDENGTGYYLALDDFRHTIALGISSGKSSMSVTDFLNCLNTFMDILQHEDVDLHEIFSSYASLEGENETRH